MVNENFEQMEQPSEELYNSMLRLSKLSNEIAEKRLACQSITPPEATQFLLAFTNCVEIGAQFIYDKFDIPLGANQPINWNEIIKYVEDTTSSVIKYVFWLLHEKLGYPVESARTNAEMVGVKPPFFMVLLWPLVTPLLKQYGRPLPVQIPAANAPYAMILGILPYLVDQVVEYHKGAYPNSPILPILNQIKEGIITNPLYIQQYLEQICFGSEAKDGINRDQNIFYLMLNPYIGYLEDNHIPPELVEKYNLKNAGIPLEVIAELKRSSIRVISDILSGEIPNMLKDNGRKVDYMYIYPDAISRAAGVASPDILQPCTLEEYILRTSSTDVGLTMVLLYAIAEALISGTLDPKEFRPPSKAEQKATAPIEDAANGFVRMGDDRQDLPSDAINGASNVMLYLAQDPSKIWSIFNKNIKYPKSILELISYTEENMEEFLRSPEKAAYINALALTNIVNESAKYIRSLHNPSFLPIFRRFYFDIIFLLAMINGSTNDEAMAAVAEIIGMGGKEI